MPRANLAIRVHPERQAPEWATARNPHLWGHVVAVWHELADRAELIGAGVFNECYGFMPYWWADSGWHSDESIEAITNTMEGR